MTLLSMLLSGCATVDFEQSISRVNKETSDFTKGKLTLVQTKEHRDEMNRIADEILRKPVNQNDAVLLALANSPALQSMLASNWSDAASSAQTGRIANPVFSFERMASAPEIELTQMIAFGLLDLLTLPQRYSKAQRLIELAELQLTASVIEHTTQVRQSWIRAVTAQQRLVFAKNVFHSAEASAELARLLQSAGNFNKLQRARQQAYYADAVTQLATAQHAVTVAREELVRLLGLTDPQAQLLVLPEHLPELPNEPIAPHEVSRAISTARLDIRLARSEYEIAAKAQGLNAITSFTDIELGLRHQTVEDKSQGSTITKQGFEVSVRLPLFDWGDAQRDSMNARTLAAANRLEATVRFAGSHLRQSYSAYRTAYEIARHYRDEVVPLRKTISEENQLRYNGMLIGVFELLADARDQANSVMAAITAQQQFWLADAALQAALIGKPMTAVISSPAVAGAESGVTAH